jgi:hypothetical protein
MIRKRDICETYVERIASLAKSIARLPTPAKTFRNLLLQTLPDCDTYDCMMTSIGLVPQA